MEIRRCMKCMNLLKPEENVCPVCGHAVGTSASESFALKPGTILDGKYLVGEMLGQGGFGITYIGFDLLLEQKVAIKEYYPMSTGMVSRENRSTVLWSSAMLAKTGVEKGFDSFLKEARKMAKLGGIPGVVGVKSVFIQNETAYIVMDFIQGQTLQKKLEKEGPMDYGTCLTLLSPIMEALAQVHKHGIIHRDISPDNIMVQPDGSLVLLDLGAAKDLEIQKSDGTTQSSQLVAKHGFSPLEQYTRSGQIGPWTDVYAMAATVYYCCTGKLPPAAVERVGKDELACRPNLTNPQFAAIAAGMAIFGTDRPQTMEALQQTLAKAKQEPPASQPGRSTKTPDPIIESEDFELWEMGRKFLEQEKRETEKKAKKQKKKRAKLPKWADFLVAVVLMVLIFTALIFQSKGKQVEKKATPSSSGSVVTRIEKNTPAKTVGKTYTMAVMKKAEGFSSDERDASPFWGQDTYSRGEVERVVFQSTLNGASKDAWDVSADGDQSVLAWMDNGTLHVAANGNISPNPDASYLFDSFQNLTQIDFGDCFDTSQVTDMSNMFHFCSSLIGLDISGFDTSNVIYMRNMFWNCSSLTSLDVSGFDTSNVTDMDGIFGQCNNLISLDVSGFDTSNVANMHAMFLQCKNLTSLDISGFDTCNVIDMREMFYNCSSLAYLDVSRFDTSLVTDMNNMFYQCSSLTSLDVSGFDTSNVTNMIHMFCECSSLTSLDVSGFDVSNVAYMNGIFDYCDKLTDFKCSDKQLQVAYDAR